MMTYIVWLVLLAIAFGVLLWDRITEATLLRRVVVFVLVTAFVLGTAWFTGLLPQTLVASLVGVLVAGLVAIYERTFRTRTLLIPIPFFVGAAIALAASQWQNPHPGPLKEENRSRREPEPSKQATIAEVLATKWSTDNEFADWPVTRLMTRLCEIAYENPVDARAELAKMGFESETINSGSMNGYVLKVDDSAVIILRGTEASLFDILQDLYFARINTDHGDLHGGFSSGYTSMHGQVQKLLDRYQPKRVWITGHSLGGALSVVCAYKLLQDQKYPIAGVMTFGQPMVVKSNMADYLGPKLKGKFVHFVNNMDPVVNIVRPYVHFGHLVWVTGDEQTIIRSSDGEAAMMAAGPVRGNNLRTEEPSLQPMTQLEFRQFLREEKAAGEPQFDPQGRPLYQGGWRNTSDHFMASYVQMVEFLVGEARAAPQRFIDHEK
jgi:hypothetical protein